MFTYTNGFHVTAKDDKSEILIQFIQTTPVLKVDETGKVDIVGTNEETVSSVIMSGALAEDLVSKIRDLLSDGGTE